MTPVARALGRARAGAEHLLKIGKSLVMILDAPCLLRAHLSVEDRILAVGLIVSAVARPLEGDRVPHYG